mgnify:CR=1 FL=1
MGILPEEEQERFRSVYCGLCHTLGKRYGFGARFILNYDFTFLAILLSEGGAAECGCARCVVHPLKKRCYHKCSPALELAADESVILAYWQLRDGVEVYLVSETDWRCVNFCTKCQSCMQDAA